jgi:hypothetical protein
LISNFHTGVNKLKELTRLEISKIEQEYDEKLNKNGLFQVYNSWKSQKKNYQFFVHIYKTYAKNGKDRELYMDRL